MSPLDAYHAMLSQLQDEVEGLKLGRTSLQIQGELRTRLDRCQTLIGRINGLVHLVAPVEKTKKRLERDEKYEQMLNKKPKEEL